MTKLIKPASAGNAKLASCAHPILSPAQRHVMRRAPHLTADVAALVAHLAALTGGHGDA